MGNKPRGVNDPLIINSGDFLTHDGNKSAGVRGSNYKVFQAFVKKLVKELI